MLAQIYFLICLQVYIPKFEDRALIAWVRVQLEGTLRGMGPGAWAAEAHPFLTSTLRHLCDGDTCRTEITAFGLQGV
jgi:hypothetical protein